MNVKKSLLLCLLLPLLIMICSAPPLMGQEKKEVMDITDISLDELLNTPVSVASKKATSIRETPGIVSVVTREDILNSGARDLVDILTLLVPGFHLGVDVEGQIGLGLRGLWGYEGKILILIDGEETNEEMFGVTVLGNHYPADMIEKIEVIRGPGSGIYGGYAELGVINIHTRKMKDGNGSFSLLWSQMSKNPSHRNLTFSYGNSYGDLDISLVGLLAQGNRSDRDNLDYEGNTLSLSDNSELNTFSFNVNARYKGLDIRAIVDLYRTTQVDLWGVNYTGGALPENFDSYILSAKYDVKAAENLTLTPYLKYKRQYPWQLVTNDQEYTNLKHADKLSIGMSNLWDISPKANLAFGAEFYTNNLYLPNNPGPWEGSFLNGEDHIGYSNISGFAQLMINTSIANLTVGGRYDYSKEFKSSFVPRIGLTKTWNNFHVKAMASQSFRIPGGIIPERGRQNDVAITPEKATNFEIELGYKFSDQIFWVINGYSITVNDTIAYLSNPETGQGSYRNGGKIGTLGVESELRYVGPIVTLACNYSFYKVTDDEVDIYVVPGEETYTLAFPAHRINLLAGIKVSPQVSIHPSLSYFGKRYGYTRYDFDLDSDVLTEFKSQFLANLNLRIRNFPARNIELSLAVTNIFGTDFSYIQPYPGYHAPLPGMDRALVLRLSFGQ